MALPPESTIEGVPAHSILSETEETSSQDLPQLAPILRLHRHTDGYVTFSVRSGDDFRHHVAIRAGELETYFPEFIQDFEKDAYVSINAGWRLSKCGPKGRAYGHPKHDSRNLRYLCACYVDIDYYRLGVTSTSFGTVLGWVVTYQDTGHIPPASMIVRSGRGMWLLWLLRDSKCPEHALWAWPEKLEVYAKVQRSIGERLARIGADAAARDPARHIRIPGSFHTGSEQQVKWWIQGSGGSGVTYTLPELAHFFGVEAQKRRPRVCPPNEPEKSRNQNRRRGWEALNARRLEDFEDLRAMRSGGFDEGCRNRAAMLYAWLLRLNGWNRDDATHEIAVLARSCRPPLPMADQRDAVKTGFGRTIRKVRDQTISDWLLVTPVESEWLDGLPPASRFQPERLSAPNLAEKVHGAEAQRRRVAIQSIVSERNGDVPTCRKMAALLGALGIHVGHVQVSHDYNALRLRTAGMLRREGKVEADTRQASLSIMT